MAAQQLCWLSDVLTGVPTADNVPDVELTGLALDSRRVTPGALFCAISGTRDDGMRYARQAVEHGAVAVCVDADRSDGPDLDVPVVRVRGLARQLSRIGANFYGDASRMMRVVGVTGTNGKTSVAHILCQLARAGGREAAFMGTLGTGPLRALEPTRLTTADAFTVQRRLADFRAVATDLVAMEVSSHALAQHRVASVAFDVGIFTNLSRDHLDYHGTMAAYGETKRMLFLMESLRSAVVNVDDRFGVQLAERIPAAVRVLGIGAVNSHAAVRLQQIRTLPEGLAFELHSPWGRHEVVAPLYGAMNAHNIAAALIALATLDYPLDGLVEAARMLTAVPGRMQVFGGQVPNGRGMLPSQSPAVRLPDAVGPIRLPRVFVDYAHTPDALDQALAAARDHARGRVIAVFGAGGDRDRGKRPLMGAAAARHADLLIVTDDNPRNEDGDRIAADVCAGVPEPAAGAPVALRVIRDRGAAIRAAIDAAGPDDVVVVAGKGHEAEQVIGERRLRFHDPSEVERALEARAVAAVNSNPRPGTE